LVELVREAAGWQQQCGDLHPEPLRYEDLDEDLIAALQEGLNVALQPRWADVQKENFDHIDPVVDENQGPTQAGSYHSTGSYQSGEGTARAARGEGRGAAARPPAQLDHPGGMLGGGAARAPAAAAAAAVAAGGGGAAAGVGQKRAAGAVPKGEQQERQKKTAKFRKDLFNHKR
jgi:hypothetical protein